MLEKEMYPFVKDFFITRGFEVRAEVLSCDVVAVMDDIMIAVEMKTQMSIKLLSQAAQRQKSFDLVYIAIPKPSFKRRTNKAFAELLHLVKRLELGLLYVDTNGEGICTEEFPPKPFSRERSLASRRAQKTRTDAMEEFLSRSEDYNIGGSVREKRMTAYRENALLIVLYIMRDGPMSAKCLKELGCGDKSYSIVYRNHYGWFERVEKGVYDITQKGRQATKKYKNVCENLSNTMQ
jgi:hypothetical protein